VTEAMNSDTANPARQSALRMLIALSLIAGFFTLFFALIISPNAYDWSPTLRRRSPARVTGIRLACAAAISAGLFAVYLLRRQGSRAAWLILPTVLILAAIAKVAGSL